MARRPKGGIFSTRFGLFKGMLFLLIAVTGWVLINARNLQEFIDTYYQRNQEAEEIQILKDRIQAMEKQQRSLRANGFEVERQVRERWGFHRPGEKVIYFKPESEVAAEEAAAEQGAQEQNHEASKDADQKASEQ